LLKKAFSLGAVATQAVSRGLEDTFLTILMQHKELFMYSEVDTNECYSDKSREKIAPAKFYGATYREALAAALFTEATTSTISVSRVSAA
jgi:hypothetical protein